MAKLTRREREVVALLAQGKRQVDIAKSLCVSPRTIEAHTKNAKMKVGAQSTFELALRVAVENLNK